MLQKQVGISKTLDGKTIDAQYRDYKDASPVKTKICNIQWKNLKNLVMNQPDPLPKFIKVSYFIIRLNVTIV